MNANGPGYSSDTRAQQLIVYGEGGRGQDEEEYKIDNSFKGRCHERTDRTGQDTCHSIPFINRSCGSAPHPPAPFTYMQEWSFGCLESEGGIMRDQATGNLFIQLFL